MLSKLWHKSVLLNFKTCSKTPITKFSSLNAVKNKISSSILLATAALGVTLYVACKQSICESLDINQLAPSVPVPNYDYAISKSRELLQRLKDEVGIPGIVVGVSIDGKTVWAEGIGYADVENRVVCSPDTVMRIASISKSLTMAAVAKLWEQGKLDLDKPVQDYVPDFPSKTYDGKPVTVTCRQLVSHLSGIRHYEKGMGSSSSQKVEKGAQGKVKNEFELREYYIKEHFKDVKSSLNIFKNDALIANPGSKFYYSTHGYTLVSAILESVAKEEFSTHMTKFFKSLGMASTYLDVNDVLIYNRSRNYVKGKKGELLNAPYVDNSYKWAGGGFLSTVGDLLQFGNAMLYSLQFTPNLLSKKDEKPSKEKTNIHMKNVSSSNPLTDSKHLPGYLKTETIEKLWTPVTENLKVKYGMGWFIGPESNECMFCEKKKFNVYHTGGAIGASSILFIVPQVKNDTSICAPKGIIVVVLANMQSVENLSKTASKIAQCFDQMY